MNRSHGIDVGAGPLIFRFADRAQIDQTHEAEPVTGQHSVAQVKRGRRALAASDRYPLLPIATHRDFDCLCQRTDLHDEQIGTLAVV